MPTPAEAGSRRAGDGNQAVLAYVVGALVIVAAVALALLRVQAANLPWHLATARLAQETGHWPVRNTFSYTFPDYPVYQQYPAFQATMWAILRAAGWGGLSVATCVGWVTAFLLVIAYAGGLRQSARFHVLWILALAALQRRMMLRPDMFTMIAFGAELLALDAFARGRTRALVFVPLVHLLWANSHQLFPLSLLLQALMFADLARQRDWRRVKLLSLALAASVLLSFATPLGWKIVLAPFRTAQSLALFRANVDEFRHVWQTPYELTLALATGVPAAWVIWRTRRLTPVFEVGLWLLSLAMLLSAVRGLMFFGPVSVALFQRGVLRARAAGETLMLPVSAGGGRILRALGLAFTAMLAGAAVYYRWVNPPLALAGTQPGFGRSIGGWAESATDFIRRAPPPGHMMNLGAPLGDAVIFWVPGVPVFVDSRLETYPVAFLQAVMAADNSDAALRALLDRHDVQWVLADHIRPHRRDRVCGLAAAGWQPVYADTATIILVRPGPATEDYRRRHAIDVTRIEPSDLVTAPAALREQQLANFRALLAALGAPSTPGRER